MCVKCLSIALLQYYIAAINVALSIMSQQTIHVTNKIRNTHLQYRGFKCVFMALLQLYFNFILKRLISVIPYYLPDFIKYTNEYSIYILRNFIEMTSLT